MACVFSLSCTIVPPELARLEISRENLTMIREIGQGEFGVVMEASAVNLSKNIKVQTVAAKMLKVVGNTAANAGFVQEAVSQCDCRRQQLGRGVVMVVMHCWQWRCDVV